MRLALLADVHGNLEALTACLEHAAAQRADRHAFLGDLVGYGADPVAVLELLTSRAPESLFIRGNHDEAAAEHRDSDMQVVARRAIEWTRTRLPEQHRSFLQGLPLTLREENLFFVHGSAEAPGDWIYVSDETRAWHSLNAAGATYVFSGHTHVPVLYYTGAAQKPVAFAPVHGVAVPVPARRRWLALVGSVGQPRDGSAAACYALFDDRKQTLTYFRVPYDWPAAAAKIRAAGLPERLAQRLARGE